MKTKQKDAKVSTHYSRALEPNYMYDWAVEAAPKLINAVRRSFPDHFPVLVYTGMSGISHAAYLACELHQYEDFPFGQMYVRKAGEQSHGSRVEAQLPYTDQPLLLIFVDDFIDSGETMAVTFRRAHERAVDLKYRVSGRAACLFKWREGTKTLARRAYSKILCV